MAKARFNSLEEAMSYVNSLPISAIIEGYARALYEEDKVEPIRISEAQFKAMFKIIGQTKDGEIERRGRRPKEL